MIDLPDLITPLGYELGGGACMIDSLDLRTSIENNLPNVETYEIIDFFAAVFN